MTQSIAIVQDRPTQMDGPFFKQLAGNKNLRLSVYFTKAGDTLKNPIDSEAGLKCAWGPEIFDGYEWKCFPTGRISQIHFARKLVASGHDFIIVSGYNSLATLAVTLWANLYRIPVGLRSDNVLLYRNKTTLKWWLKDRILPRLLRLYTTGHPVGTLARNYFVHYGMTVERLFIFPYSVNDNYIIPIYEEALKERFQLRQRFKIPSNNFVVLGIVKFTAREDPLTLVKAYHDLVKRHPNSSLLLVGDGELRPLLQKYIQDNNCSNVIMPGYQPYKELFKFFAMADVFVHPAREECWGVSVNEAMVCGVPVVVADSVGSAFDLVRCEETGFVFKAGDFVELANTLSSLLSNDSLKQVVNKAKHQVSSWSYTASEVSIMRALDSIGERTTPGTNVLQK
jgi:glycosyltransferase involved in cell wall biosynthesis